ncbi:hypothetical protein [Streptomyces sp. NBC_01304]|uniref:hypothetical protein n=1 Tax=Streptomyces sp. NBC_01304 TaxID=2903818 RepID=UPI002E140341|nr:hypothetical protein OG430_20760 [Streptomyces sp. NBC_01304]
MLNQGDRGIGRAVPTRPRARSDAAYLRVGAAVVLYAISAACWIGYELSESGAVSGSFFKALYDPRTEVTPWAQTASDWALIAAALVFGGLALARRQVARGALMLLAVLLIGLSLRELVGLALSPEYRQVLENIGYGRLLVAFRVAGLVVGVAALVEMARAGRRSAPRHLSLVPLGAAGAPGFGPPRLPGSRVRPRSAVAGSCFLAIGAVLLGWLVHALAQDNGYLVPGHPDAGVPGFFRDAFDASYATTIPNSYYTLAFALAPVLIGIALFRGAPAARGAGLALSAITLYVDARTSYGYFAQDRFDLYFDSTLSTLSVLSTFLTTLLALAALAVLVPAREE